MTKNEMLSSVASTAEILADFRAGKMVILIDDEDRENEGDLLIAADFVTPEAINFMARHARGLVCLTLTEERCRRLRLPLMTAVNGTKMSTNFTMSIEAAEGVTTGISAADRARTIQAAVAADAKPSDIVQPGHVFPVMARPGGVLTRAGHTEAGCDLGALTGLTPSAVICEIMKEDGTMARLPDLIEFAREHGLKIGTIADLIAYRSAHESMIERIGQHKVQTGSPTATRPWASRIWRWSWASRSPIVRPGCACTSRSRRWICWGWPAAMPGRWIRRFRPSSPTATACC